MSVNASGSKFPNSGPAARPSAERDEKLEPRPTMECRAEESGTPPRLALARSAKPGRLLKHADFQRVYQGGRRQFTGNMTVFFLRRQGEGAPECGPRVGFTVGKVLGGAVERNRIKRRMREAVRLAPPVCAGALDIVLHPRKSVLTLPFAELQSEVARCLRLAEQRARAAEPKTRVTEPET